MGARQSYQTDIDRRPRSNSTVETGVDGHNGASGRRAHYRHNQSADYDYDDDPDDPVSDFTHFHGDGVAEDGGDSAAASASHRRVASRGHHHHHHHHHHRTSAGSQSGGARFSLRANARNSLLQALTGMTASSSADTSAGSSTAPAAVFSSHGRDIKCPICHKKVPSDEAEVHLVMCFTRPRIAYNDDVLESDKGECSICLDEMNAGDTIARLPCLCIYHKTCIDEWFQRKNCCPEHPGED